jgi:hypothetical protein
MVLPILRRAQGSMMIKLGGPYQRVAVTDTAKSDNFAALCVSLGTIPAAVMLGLGH